MRRPMLFVATLTALLLFPAAAAAKGPSAATISGPGLSHAITIEGFGEGDSTSPLGILVTETGFFPQAFEQTPSSTTRSRPPDRRHLTGDSTFLRRIRRDPGSAYDLPRNPRWRTRQE